MPINCRSSRSSLRAFGASTLALAALACSDSSGPGTPTPPLVDARVVAFASTAGNNNGLSIYLMHADGTSRRRLTSDGFLDETPVWSPNGSSIAFDTNRDPASIWIMNADGTNLRPFITSAGFDQPSGLAWSPDGRQFEYTVVLHARNQIFRMNADGSNVRAITTDTTVTNVSRAWKPAP
jgi:Tol biopolymer transport system component